MKRTNITVKFFIFSYIHLWIIEGAIRKWIPGTSEIFYYGRDLLILTGFILLILEIKPFREKIWFGLGFLGLIVWATAAAITSSSLLTVWAVGLHSYISPFLGFLFVWFFCRIYIIRGIERIVVGYSFIQFVITVFQVISDPDAFINSQVGGEDAYFVNDGIVRAAGTFSAPAGLLVYIMIALAVSLARVGIGTRPTKILNTIAIALLIGTAALSGSRGVLVIVAVMLAAFIIWNISQFKLIYLLRNMPVVILVAIVFFVVVDVFPDVYSAFTARVADASQHEDTSARLVDQTFGFLTAMDSIIGNGPGAHSHSGAVMGSQLQWIENESVRWVMELGLIGLVLGCTRLVLGVLVAIKMVRKFRRSLPSVMYSICLAITLFQGSITQNPSSQGAFSIVLLLWWMESQRKAGESVQTESKNNTHIHIKPRSNNR